MTPEKQRRAQLSGRGLSRLLIVITMLTAGSAHAALDLRNATVERLDNGLTIILLEDRHFPVVSVQMLYRVGARDEVTGKTGLAHFLEHMAFRDSRHFPDTALVSQIYAVGGEWHGYTWIDQTTYFATVPRERLELLLRIEADRMDGLLISEEDMDAERGAVLTEMHMYENSPTSMLIDAVNTTSFLAHPYRNNTIGWESDVENLQHADVVGFYEQHYHPANAVLAIVGDFDRKKVRERIGALFGRIRGRAPTPLPHTREPVQNGERRVTLLGDSADRQFMIAYRAPSAHSPDFAAFLVLQEILGAGSGVNFRQNDWGTPVDTASALHGAADDVTTWFPPSAQDYVFVIGGFAPADVATADVEQRVEDRIAMLRRELPASTVLTAAIDDVLDQLAYDVETTEDAAHQLAYFDGLHALDTVLELPQRVVLVTAEDVQRTAQRYLLPERRSIAWYLPSEKSANGIGAPQPESRPVLAVSPRQPIAQHPVPPAVISTLNGGIPVIVQRSDLSSSVQLRIVLAANGFTAATANDPIRGYSSFRYKVRPDQLGKAIALARHELATARVEPGAHAEPSADPETRLEQVFEAIMGDRAATEPSPADPALIVVAGEVVEADTLAMLNREFGNLRAAAGLVPRVARRDVDDRIVHIGRPVAQAQVGYIVPAPGPRNRLSDAYRLLLYIVSHGYEGRLGKQAISDTGLAYYIGSQFRSDGTDGWITLATGVDPHKIEPLTALLIRELERLNSEPPTAAELREAKNHFIGRLQSAAQSNEELVTMLAEQWLWYGELMTASALQDRLAAISRQDILDIVGPFANGATIVVAE